MIYVNDNIDNISEKELQEVINALPDWRKAQTMRFKHQRGRIESAFSYLLLCEALRERGIKEPPTFIYGKEGNDGKPSLKEHPELFFNLSHCKRAVVCAVSEQPVGIDVEMLGHYSERLANYTMNADELAEIAAASDKDLAFTRLWTMKEATMKLTGEGIGTNVRDVLRNTSIIYNTRVCVEKGYVVTSAEYASPEKQNNDNALPNT